MNLHTFWGFQVEIDEAATQNWYAAAAPWGCDCGHCRNFLALTLRNALPSSVTEPLRRLGIPPEKATYVGHLYSDSNGHLYQFSYRVAGSILSEPEGEPHTEARCCHEPYPYGTPDFPEPHFDLEFYLTLPWILPEP